MVRHKGKAGRMGGAKINVWYGETDNVEKMEKLIEVDLIYINNGTVLWDLKSIFVTILKVFINKNAY